MINTSNGHEIRIFEHLKEVGVLKGPFITEKTDWGLSGASLYTVRNSTGEILVVKNAPLAENSASEVNLDKEYIFYTELKNDIPIKTPKVIYAEKSKEHGIILVFPLYKRIDNQEWTYEKIITAIGMFAKLHTSNTKKLIDYGLIHKKSMTPQEKLEASFNAWIKVFDRHNVSKGKADLLMPIFNKFEQITDLQNSNVNDFCHCDAHTGNFVLDGEGDLLLLDWQNVNIGKGEGDISFFINFAETLGVNMYEKDAVYNYCKKRSEYGGVNINPKDVFRVMHAANVSVSFICWPDYLGEAGLDRINGIFDKMLTSFRTCFD